MQARLFAELKAAHPNDVVVCEQNFVDVTVETKTEIILYEIKSDLEPKSVIRQALGQIMEYAFHPPARQTLPVRLVIVGQNSLNESAKVYLNVLRFKFGIPLEYKVIKI